MGLHHHPLAGPGVAQDAVALVARLLLAAIFVHEGWLKIVAYQDVAGYMASFGVPAGLLPLVIATELGGGLLVAAGLLTRLAAFALAGFCGLTALLFHANAGDMTEMIQFQKNLSMAGGFLALVAFGPGGWSLDAWIVGRRVPRPAAGAVP